MRAALCVAAAACVVAAATAAPPAEDEFDIPAPAAGAAAAPPKPQGAAAAGPASYTFEVLVGAAVIAYVVFYFIGTRANRTIAASVGEVLLQLKKEWSQVGEVSLSSKKPVEPKARVGALEKESEISYTSWVTGRRGALGMAVDLTLRSRQDALSSALDAVLGTGKDTLVLDIALPARAQGFVFSLTEAVDVATFLESAVDVKLFTKEVGVKALPEGFKAALVAREAADSRAPPLKIFTEHGELAYGFLSALPSLIKPLRNGSLKSLAVTDHASINSNNRMHRMSETTARLELVLPSGPAAAAAAAATALEVVAELIAVMADWPVPAGAVATLKSKRAEYMKGLEKAAAEEKRRAAEEAKKKEEAEARKKMTPAEREKADKAAKEKEAKKAGAGGPRVKMVTR